MFYNAWNGSTLQFPLILAAVTPVDDDETFQAKVRMVAGFIDLFKARRMVSFRNFGYNTVQYTMFNLIKEIRDVDLAELADTLGSRVADLEGDFSVVDDYRLHQRNSNHVKYMLARLTAWLEGECGSTATFADLVGETGRIPSRSSISGPITRSSIPSSIPSRLSLTSGTNLAHCFCCRDHSMPVTATSRIARNCLTTVGTIFLPSHCIRAVTRIIPVS